MMNFNVGILLRGIKCFWLCVLKGLFEILIVFNCGRKGSGN